MLASASISDACVQAGQDNPAPGIQDYDWDPAWPAAEMADHVYAALRTSGS